MSQAATQLAVSPGQVAGQPGLANPDQTGWTKVQMLPCNVSVEVSVPGFTLKTLLGLHAASVVSTQRPTTANLPLRVNGELFAWCEFEVLGNRLSVRLTELA